MRKTFLSMILALGLLAIPQSSDAQFFKQLGKALESAGKNMLNGSSSQQGASIQFSNLRLTYDQKDVSNGRTMLQLHYTLTAVGLQGHKLVPVLVIEIPKGTAHKFADGNDMKSVGNELTCGYQSTTFNGQWQAIYIDALNPLPGKQTYYACIYVVDKTANQVVAQSEYMTFTNVGEQKNSQSHGQRSQQQASRQQSNVQHMEFQGIKLGQAGVAIKRALVQKGFKAREYDLSGTISGMPVSIWVDNDGNTLRVTLEKSFTKVTGKQQYQTLKSKLAQEYNGEILEGSMTVDFGEGVIISTDRGFIELMYHNDDEMGEGSSTSYTVTYLLKDAASMSAREVLVESTNTVGDIISAKSAISLYYCKDMDIASEILRHLGYSYTIKDNRGYQYWCKNCSLTKALKPTAFTKGASSIVKIKTQGQPDVRVQVFNEKATQSFFNQLEKLEYSWQGTGSGTGALEWKKDISNQNEKSFWLISEKAYYYQQHGGYFLILGGSLD